MVMENNKNMKLFKSKNSIEKRNKNQLKDKREIKNGLKEIANIVEKFYSNLYTSLNPKPDIQLPDVINVGSEEITDITIEELKHTLSQM